ncbi:hemerythrin-like metal-binding domain protein [Alteromonadaceae bacterium Bs31]|nr:hemerythrin-like metal-binding domain protein [Alteromonadaceae bacterium Bs31]
MSKQPYSPELLLLSQQHETFLKLIKKMRGAATADFILLFTAMFAHLESHFAAEQSLMIKSDYPGTNEHFNDHLHVLNVLQSIKEDVTRGGLAEARLFVQGELAHWFEEHLQTMDEPLDSYLAGLDTNSEQLSA